MEGKRKSFNSIDEYIANFPAEVQKKLRELRSVIKAAAPDAEERISYQIPAFTLKGNLPDFTLKNVHYKPNRRNPQENKAVSDDPGLDICEHGV